MKEEESDNYEQLYKIIIIGDSGVGKSNILGRYLHNEFKHDTKSTVGVEFGSKQFTVENHQIKAQIWDTAGQERYKAITSAYYKGAKGAFVVYDITRKNTFETVNKWVSDISAAADKKITLILIGNKNDLEDQRQVTKEMGEEKAKELGLAFMETSACSGENLDKAFQLMINEIYKKSKEDIMGEGEENIVQQGKDITLDKTKGKPAKKKCC